MIFGDVTNSALGLYLLMGTYLADGCLYLTSDLWRQGLKTVCQNSDRVLSFWSLWLVSKGKEFWWRHKFSVKDLSLRGNDLADGCLNPTNDVDILLWNVCCNSLLIFWCHYLIYYIRFVNCHHFLYVCFFWLSSYVFQSFTFLLKNASNFQ